MSSMAGRRSGDVGGLHIWGYGLQSSLMEYNTDRRSVGSDPQSFGITWLISRVTVVIISLGPGQGISLDLKLHGNCQAQGPLSRPG